MSFVNMRYRHKRHSQRNRCYHNLEVVMGAVQNCFQAASRFCNEPLWLGLCCTRNGKRHYTTLFRLYSITPSAPRALSRGIRSRTVD